MRYLICVAIILTVVGCKDSHKGSGPIQINPEWGEPMEPEPDEYIAPIICDVPQCGTNVLGLTAGATSEHELRRVPIEQIKEKVRAVFSARTPEAEFIRELALGMNDSMPPLSSGAQAWLVTALDTAAPGWRVPQDVQTSEQPNSGISTGRYALETSGCGEMALQMALTGVTVEQRDDNFLGDRVYCVIQAKDGEQIEVLHTPVTEALHPDQTGRFADSIFYGREGPRDPGERLEIQYDCWEQDSPAEYEQIREVIDQIERFGKIIAKVTGQGQYVAVIVNVAKAARLITEIAAILDGDDHLWQSEESFERRALWTQIIEHNRTLVAGGVHSGSRWAWKLHLQIDGCAGKVEPAPRRDPEQPSCRQSCDGCCVGDECRSGSAAEACGSGGDACYSCDPGESCNRGACQFDDRTQFSVVAMYAVLEQCYSSQPFDAYLKIEAGGRQVQTMVEHSCQPSWHANVLTASARSLMDRLIVEVWDADLVFDDQLGVCQVPLSPSDLLAGELTFLCGNIAEVTLGFEPR